MENTVDISVVEERMHGENGGLEERAEEQVAVTVIGGKVNDGEEVFEEAVDSQEEGVNPGTVAGNIIPEKAADMSMNMPSVDGSSGAEQEVEKFEEAMGTLTLDGNNGKELHVASVEAVGVEFMVNREDIEGVVASSAVDEGGTEEIVTTDSALEGKEEDDAKLVAEVVAEEQMKNVVSSAEEQTSNVVNEQIKNLEAVLDQSENGELTWLTEEEKTVDGNEALGQENAHLDGVLKGEIPPNDDQGDKLNESKIEAEGQVDENQDPVVASDGNHPGDLHAGKDALVTEINGHVDREPRSAPLDHDLGSQDPNGKEQKDVLPTSHAEQQGQSGSNGKVKEDSAAVATHDTEMHKQPNIPADTPAPTVEGLLTPEIASSIALEESVDEMSKKNLDGESIFVAKKESLEPQPPVADGNIHENFQDKASPEKLKKKNIKDEVTEKFQKQREIHPAAKMASSSTKPSNHTSTASNSAPARPAGLGHAAPLLEPAPRAATQQTRVNAAVSNIQAQQIEDATNGEAEEHDETREKLQMIRVKFLRLAHRLGQTPHNVVVAQVLYRLGLAEQLRGRNGGRVGAFSFDRASAMAEQLEASGQEPLDFSCTIMVLGKTGVGKSATINSIFDEMKFSTDAFDMGTKKVQDVCGTVQGIKVRVIDTPGLLPSWTDQRHNEKILHSVKRFIRKTPPDIVLYLDRLDMQSRDMSDMPLLRTITEIFGPSIWFNAIVVLTHAASAPPDGPNGTASSYDMFVTQRSHVVQQAIRQAAGDMRLMNPVSLVENHSACRTNRAGQRVLPNGQVWKPHLLLLSFASKILAEANALLKLQDSPPGKLFTARSRAPPLPFLLSSLLQPRPQLKLPDEQFGDEDGMDDDLYESSDSEEETEYDELPPFKRLTKAQLAKLNRAQKKAYFEELEYREKLFMKKQLKEERRRRRMMKKMADAAKDQAADFGENVEEESVGAASVPVPMPDLALPASFDSDNPTHRYRYLDTANQWLVRPVLETHGWDHDVGYEGINAERLFVVKDRVPISLSGQVTMDKKDANVQMELASSIKHGEGKVTSLGLDMQTVGKDLAYTLRSETRFCNYRRNKAAAGLSVTLLNDALSAGFKVEDKLIVNKWFRLLLTGGVITARGDIAYGGSLDATLRDKDYPLGHSLFTLGLSVMDWHGDLAIGGNAQSQFPIGRFTNLIARASLNNRGAGQVSVRVNSSEQLQIALLGLVPLFKKLIDYRQQLLFGQ